ncbi:Peptidase M1 [Spraguea lophii 42_110]|uniref:Aminopeptidase n=1 Tax=Spraguea lophii (strain 42_110) TaxID=1358809 RepID=S7XU43_SPRLO|nr:Peptidase M1 [Spraguea lophii 42_110]
MFEVNHFYLFKVLSKETYMFLFFVAPMVAGNDYWMKVYPVNYFIDIVVQDDDYLGVNVIKVQVKEKTDKFAINSKGLKIEEIVMLEDKNSFDEVRREKRVKYSDDVNLVKEYKMEDDEIKIYTKELEVREYLLLVKYQGVMKDNMEGFYKSVYKVGDEKKIIYSTHFEPGYARLAIPCFDHPLLKAVFKMKITADKKFSILSNTEVVKEEINENNKIVEFADTPKMSTYLLAFVIGEIEFLEDKLDEITLRTYTVEGLKDLGEFSLKVTKKSLEVYGDYFGVKYPLKKLDNVAIPEFSMGAMENWGLVTYRNTALLYDKNISTVNALKRVSEVICHELAHQWFGNLVTMKWWKDLWLNEGFATWAAMKCITKFPKDIIDWDVETTFMNDEVYRGMELDSLNNTHPIEVEVKTPEEVEQIFDAISYSKSSSLIRMVENYIGETNFQQRLQNYIKKYQYSNAESADLWNALSDTKHDVYSLMNDWTKKEGFPLLRITEEENEIKITQERFFKGIEKDTKGEKWFIPLKIKFGDKEILVEMKEKEIKIEKQDKDFKINNEGVGFYSTLYEDKILKVENLSVRNRLNYINDLVLQSLSSYIKLDTIINISTFAKNENNHEVLSALLLGITGFKNILYEDKKYFEELILDIIKDRKVDFNNPGNNINDLSNTILIANLLVANNENNFIDKIYSKWEEYKKDKNSINSVFRSALFSAVAKKENNLEDFLEIYDKGVVEEKTAALVAMGKFTDKNAYLKAVELLYTEEILLQDKIILCSGLISSLEFKDIFIQEFMNNYDKIKVAFKNNGSLLSYAIETLFSSSYGMMFEKSKIFLMEIKSEGIERAVDKAIEKAEIKNEFRKKNLKGKGN